MKRVEFPMGIDLQTEKEIRTAMQEEAAQPEVVRQARQEAYEKIREIARAREVQKAMEPERAVKSEKSDELEKDPENAKKLEDHMELEKVRETKKATELEKVMKSEKTRTKRMEKDKRDKKHRWNGWKTFGSIAAAAAVFSGVCITNPAFAAKIPLVGHVFERLGDSLGFAGDFEEYAVPLNEEMINEEKTDGTEDFSNEIVETGRIETGTKETGTEGADTKKTGTEETATEIIGTTVIPAESKADTDSAGISAENEESVKTKDSAFSKTSNGVTVTLSELYCNEKALYLSMLITSEEPFPETFIAQWDAPIINLYGGSLKLSYNPQEQLNYEYLDGQMIDEHTYAGVLRLDLNETLRWTEIEEGAVDEEKMDEDLIVYHTAELPEQFSVDLQISKIVGDLPAELVTTPEMPQDLIDEYEQAMAEAGLDPSDEAYASYTEEEADIELALRNKQWNEYAERYPGVNQYPNTYENWWFDGDWDFHFDVTVDHSETIMKMIDTADACEIGEIQVTKTPFEIVLDYDYSKAIDYFITVLDANGIPMEYGHNGGSVDTHPTAEYDVSKIMIYVCDYVEYMDELKGYYYTPDYEEKAKEKTYQQLLDERCVWSEEVEF
ncbi:MAG: hypothetical protein IJW67_06905 [Blautia sp.]|nr:hypothetical protein [Blautia sp.]